MDPIAKAQQDAREKKIQESRGENPYAEGTRYYDLWANNPYSREKFTREQTFWDRFANAWGMRSSYDAALDEWNKSALEYDAQIAQLKGEDEYNSEQAKAARLRGAGLNPDLVGLESASEAGEFAQEQTSPDINRESEQVEKVVGLISEIPKVLTLALSVSEGAAKSLGSVYETGMKHTDAIQKRMNLAKSWIDDYNFDESDMGDGEPGKFNYNETVGAMKINAKQWALENGFRENDAIKFADNVWELANGAKKTDLYEAWTKRHEARRKYGSTITSKYDVKKDNEEHFVEVLGELVNWLDEALEGNTSAESLKAQNEENYQMAYNGRTAGEAANAENKATKGKAQLKEEARAAIKKANSMLDEECKKGKVGAILAKSALDALYLKYLE